MLPPPIQFWRLSKEEEEEEEELYAVDTEHMEYKSKIWNYAAKKKNTFNSSKYAFSDRRLFQSDLTL